MNSEDDFLGPVNGSQTEFTMLELAELVIALTQSKYKIIHLPLPQTILNNVSRYY
jgi:UDP-glucuronate decarboxylase